MASHGAAAGRGALRPATTIVSVTIDGTVAVTAGKAGASAGSAGRTRIAAMAAVQIPWRRAADLRRAAAADAQATSRIAVVFQMIIVVMTSTPSSLPRSIPRCG